MQQQFNIFGSNSHSATPTGVPGGGAVLPLVQCDELVEVTFIADWDEKEEVSVMVEGTLTDDSAMEDVMIHGNVSLELGGDMNESYKYLIQK